LNRLRLGEVAGLQRYERRLGGVEVQFSDSSKAGELADFLRGLCFEVRLLDGRTLEARFREPLPANEKAARLELDLYLRVWEAMHPDAWAVRVE
jgi:hypothetical protein